MKITNLKSRQIFDSRGNPTVETDLVLNNNSFGRAAVPSGASKGIYEAIELRDKTNDYNGKGILTAVEKINKDLKNKLLNIKFDSQEVLDNFLIDLDGTTNKSNLGANTILSISIAFAKARANIKNKNLFQIINNPKSFSLPKPMLNIINGGAHADNGLDIQEFMIIPVKYDSISKNLKIACEIFHSLKKILKKNSFRVNTGDEGGFAPNIKTTNHAFRYYCSSN